ncbi:MAG: WYL domain-containing protein [Candidatus Eremiobacteraeota bacterium]|nr:WYL domain-containing protein [Candidatus Eremiobacteraeota bacterium]
MRRAVWDDRRLEIRYRDRNGARTSRRIDPLGLVSKSGVWYVIARDGSENRSFRADRIAAVELLTERFERPPNFDLDEYWSQSTQQYAAGIVYYPVTVRIENGALDELTAYWRTANVEPDGDAHSLVRFDFPSRGVAIHQLIAWSQVATVVEPVEIIPDVVGLARALIARYESLAPVLS